MKGRKSVKMFAHNLAAFFTHVNETFRLKFALGNFLHNSCDTARGVHTAVIWEKGDEDSNFSVFTVRRFTEWRGPLHWIAFPVETLTKVSALNRRLLAIYTADEGIARNSAARTIFTHFLRRRNRGLLAIFFAEEIVHLGASKDRAIFLGSGKNRRRSRRESRDFWYALSCQTPHSLNHPFSLKNLFFLSTIEAEIIT